MPHTMSPRERLEAVFSGGPPDRTPILGGWIACPEHVCALACASQGEYWADPEDEPCSAPRMKTVASHSCAG